MFDLNDLTLLLPNQRFIAFFPQSMRCEQHGSIHFVAGHNCRLQGGDNSCVSSLFVFHV